MELDDFLSWCGTLFNEPVENLTLETAYGDIEGWDSMGALLLMADLDEIYDIQLDEGELMEIKNLGDIKTLIETRAGGEE
jgi:acyl carrier protein